MQSSDSSYRKRETDLRYFYEHAKRIEGNKGNAPGFPHQFGYLPAAANLNAVTENISFSPTPALEISQHKQVTEATGMRYYDGGMVPELPFDMKGFEKKNAIWTTLGFASLLVGVIFWARSQGR